MAYRAYRAACDRGEVALGHMFVFDRGMFGPRRYIFNFPTKGHWRNTARLDDIRSGLDDLLLAVRRTGVQSIAIPALGCGNGGLEWLEVRPLIEAACQTIPDVRCVIFAPEGAPPPSTMPDATPRPPLTGPRALLLSAIAVYLDRARLQEFREGVSELEIQKLAYFLQLAGAPFNLRFVRGTYGPYSDRIGQVLTALEGHYLTGLGDRSSRVTDLAPITPTTGTPESSADLLERHPEHRAQLSAVLDLVAGFEAPYSLELLATVHWASIQPPPTRDIGALSDRVSAWSLRKARLFTDAHIRLAAERLTKHRLLAEEKRRLTPDASAVCD
ncbi:type II toxin-antitoxin system antitoxin DNA ADP-ribosyl glycohydrolase DarG [Actinoplanes campanulatus]|uniref:type II toxin-antitoxin system antitoxin DNA ADP-ribosyl glycohydrolase DarG n=1 Tax=Actinoplanes campanulatus TaxID=113559 RepID=UPI003C12BB50